MKKIILSLIALMATMGISAQVIKVYKNNSATPEATYTNSNSDKYKVVFEEAPATTGEAAVSESAGISGNKVQWVQLWADGPKFATINVGQTVTDYSTITTESYSLANVGGLYTWGGTANSNGGTYSDDHNTGSAVLTGDNDTATKLWGSAWRMPTQAELSSLTNSTNCTWTWCDGSTTQYVSGCTLKGYKVSGIGAYASNSVFLPAAGYFDADYGSVFDQGYVGCYWSSTPTGDGVACPLNFYSGNQDVYSLLRRYGYSVRAVLQ